MLLLLILCVENYDAKKQNKQTHKQTTKQNYYNITLLLLVSTGSGTFLSVRGSLTLLSETERDVVTQLSVRDRYTPVC